MNRSAVRTFIENRVPYRLRHLLMTRTPLRGHRFDVRWHRRDEGSWLATRLQGTRFIPPVDPNIRTIGAIVRRTNARGALPLWQGYGKPNATRRPARVSTASEMGSFYSWLTRQRRPAVIVEFGTAFGVSGMYWLSGLEHNGGGELFTYEPNAIWHEIARGNLEQLSRRFHAFPGRFEDRWRETLNGRPIDIALIDAIHRKEVVMPQFELVCESLRPGGLVVLDDIHFSSSMREAWDAVARDDRMVSSVELGSIGIVERQGGA